MSKSKKNANLKKRQQEDKNFKISLSITCAILLVFVLGFFGTKYLPDLIKEWKYKASLVDFTRQESYIVDENGNKFYATNRSLEAINTDLAYGLLDGAEYRFISFMHEEGKIPEYIVRYENGQKGEVLRLENAKNITLSDFLPVSADICPSNSSYPNDYFIAHDKYLQNGKNNKNDEEYINMVFDSLTKGEEVSPPLTQKSSVWLKLKSQKYPGLYYCVVFVLDENEIAYLYDVGSGKYVLAPDKLTVRLS